jgi:hypothetical protein
MRTMHFPTCRAGASSLHYSASSSGVRPFHLLLRTKSKSLSAGRLPFERKSARPSQVQRTSTVGSSRPAAGNEDAIATSFLGHSTNGGGLDRFESRVHEASSLTDLRVQPQPQPQPPPPPPPPPPSRYYLALMIHFRLLCECVVGNN